MSKLKVAMTQVPGKIQLFISPKCFHFQENFGPPLRIQVHTKNVGSKITNITNKVGPKGLGL